MSWRINILILYLTFRGEGTPFHQLSLQDFDQNGQTIEQKKSSTDEHLGSLIRKLKKYGEINQYNTNYISGKYHVCNWHIPFSFSSQTLGWSNGYTAFLLGINLRGCFSTQCGSAKSFPHKFIFCWGFAALILLPRLI